MKSESNFLTSVGLLPASLLNCFFLPQYQQVPLLKHRSILDHPLLDLVNYSLSFTVVLHSDLSTVLGMSSTEMDSKNFKYIYFRRMFAALST